MGGHSCVGILRNDGFLPFAATEDGCSDPVGCGHEHSHIILNGSISRRASFDVPHPVGIPQGHENTRRQVCCCLVALLPCLFLVSHLVSLRCLAPPTFVSVCRVATSLMASSMPIGYNPGPTLDQKRQLQSYLDENEAKGAPVHSFNPDASPQEKAAIAGKAQSQLQSVRQQQQTVASSAHILLTTLGSLAHRDVFPRPSCCSGRNRCARGTHCYHRRRGRKARAATRKTRGSKKQCQ